MGLSQLSPVLSLMRRFYSPLPETADQPLELSPEILRHLIRVLRQPPGSRFELFDGGGRIAKCRLAEDNRHAHIEQLELLPEPTLSIELIQGLAKGEKLDLILQKNCELGLNRFILADTERSVLKLSGSKQATKVSRWQKIAREACRQCGQPFVPEVEYCGGLPNALDKASGELKLMLWEEAHRPLKDILPDHQPQRISLLVGPEGGFSATEARQAQARGFEPVRLGPRILRTETAGLAILSILQYLYGDLDSDVNSFSSTAHGKELS